MVHLQLVKVSITKVFCEHQTLLCKLCEGKLGQLQLVCVGRMERVNFLAHSQINGIVLYTIFRKNLF